jgi:hypothetical protein
MRADELLNTSVRMTKVRTLAAKADDTGEDPDEGSHANPYYGTTHALITTANKKQNAPGGKRAPKAQVDCLAKGCTTLTPPHLRLCRMHYHECIAGKYPSLPLKTGDSATYDPSTSKIVFPHLASTPSAKRPVRALVAAASGKLEPQN